MQNLTIVGLLESKNYKPGDHLECWADGNPVPTYEWTELGTDNITRGPILIVDEPLLQSQRFSYQCTAWNVVAGQRTSASKKAVVNVVVENQSGTTDFYMQFHVSRWLKLCFQFSRISEWLKLKLYIL